MKRNEVVGILLLVIVAFGLFVSVFLIDENKIASLKRQLKKAEQIAQVAKANYAGSQDQLKTANDEIMNLQAKIAATPPCPEVTAPKVEAPAPVRWEDCNENVRVLITNIPNKHCVASQIMEWKAPGGKVPSGGKHYSLPISYEGGRP